MAEQELSLIIRLQDEASAQLRQMNSEIKANAQTWQESFGAIKGQLQSAGLMLSGFGAAVLGSFGLAYKASEEDRLAIARLSITLKNLGIDYNNVSASLTDYIEKTALSTGIADGEQIGALNQLLLTTGNYEQALKLLPIALDLAAAKQMNVATSALLVGRVAEGDIHALGKYGFAMDGVKSSGEALNVLQEKIKGSAEALLSPFESLKTQLKALGKAIGDLVAGPIGTIINKVIDVVVAVREWVKANPELATTLADVGIALGVGAAAAGGLALAILGVAVALGVLGGPVTLALLAIAALAAEGVFLVLRWDWVKEQWINIWPSMRNAIATVFGPIVFMVEYIGQLAGLFLERWDSAKGFWANIWNGIKVVVLNVVNDMIGAIETFTNWFVAKLNWVLDWVNKLGELFGQHWEIAIPEIKIPRLTEEMMGIFSKPEELPGGAGGHGVRLSGGLPPTPTPVDVFGNYGNPGYTAVLPGGGTVNITINNAGSVISEQDLNEQIRQGLLRLQLRVPGTGIKQ